MISSAGGPDPPIGSRHRRFPSSACWDRESGVVDEQVDGFVVIGNAAGECRDRSEAGEVKLLD
ncbi:hypothetical protein ACLBWH_18155 [Sphingomonas sp. M6A6_1c]